MRPSQNFNNPIRSVPVSFVAVDAGSGNHADATEDQITALQEDVNRLSRVLTEITRHLRPDLALLYADYEALMVADLIAEYGEDGLVEELMGPNPGMWVT